MKQKMNSKKETGKKVTSMWTLNNMLLNYWSNKDIKVENFKNLKRNSLAVQWWYGVVTTSAQITAVAQVQSLAKELPHAKKQLNKIWHTKTCRKKKKSTTSTVDPWTSSRWLGGTDPQYNQKSTYNFIVSAPYLWF